MLLIFPVFSFLKSVLNVNLCIICQSQFDLSGRILIWYKSHVYVLPFKWKFCKIKTHMKVIETSGIIVYFSITGNFRIFSTTVIKEGWLRLLIAFNIWKPYLFMWYSNHFYSSEFHRVPLKSWVFPLKPQAHSHSRSTCHRIDWVYAKKPNSQIDSGSTVRWNGFLVVTIQDVIFYQRFITWTTLSSWYPWED